MNQELSQFEKGKFAGYNEGFEKGKFAGYDEGCEEGYEEGYNQGYGDGSRDGWAEKAGVARTCTQIAHAAEDLEAELKRELGDSFLTDYRYEKIRLILEKLDKALGKMSAALPCEAD